MFEDKVEQKLSVFKPGGRAGQHGAGDRQQRQHARQAAGGECGGAYVREDLAIRQDEAFVVNFNDDYYLDTEHDFTSDIDEMKDALERIDARGSTALYDAVIGSLDHLKKGHKDKKVLLVVTDGEDNASRHTLENVDRKKRSVPTR